MKIDDKHFKCDACQNVFRYNRKTWSEQQAIDEANTNGFNPEIDKCLICDDCYERAKQLGLVSA